MGSEGARGFVLPAPLRDGDAGGDDDDGDDPLQRKPFFRASFLSSARMTSA